MVDELRRRRSVIDRVQNIVWPGFRMRVSDPSLVLVVIRGYAPHLIAELSTVYETRIRFRHVTDVVLDHQRELESEKALLQRCQTRHPLTGRMFSSAVFARGDADCLFEGDRHIFVVLKSRAGGDL